MGVRGDKDCAEPNEKGTAASSKKLTAKVQKSVFTIKPRVEEEEEEEEEGEEEDYPDRNNDDIVQEADSSEEEAGLYNITADDDGEYRWRPGLHNGGSGPNIKKPAGGNHALRSKLYESWLLYDALWNASSTSLPPSNVRLSDANVGLLMQLFKKNVVPKSMLVKNWPGDFERGGMISAHRPNRGHAFKKRTAEGKFLYGTVGRTYTLHGSEKKESGNDFMISMSRDEIVQRYKTTDDWIRWKVEAVHQKPNTFNTVDPDRISGIDATKYDTPTARLINSAFKLSKNFDIQSSDDITSKEKQSISSQTPTITKNAPKGPSTQIKVGKVKKHDLEDTYMNDTDIDGVDPRHGNTARVKNEGSNDADIHRSKRMKTAPNELSACEVNQFNALGRLTGREKLILSVATYYESLMPEDQRNQHLRCSSIWEAHTRALDLEQLRYQYDRGPQFIGHYSYNPQPPPPPTSQYPWDQFGGARN